MISMNCTADCYYLAQIRFAMRHNRTVRKKRMLLVHNHLENNFLKKSVERGFFRNKNQS